MALLIGAEQKWKRFNYCDFPTYSSEKKKEGKSRD